jgi:molybdenum cofactor guanylyltransferase
VSGGSKRQNAPRTCLNSLPGVVSKAGVFTSEVRNHARTRPIQSLYHRGMGDPGAADISAFILAGGKSTRMGRDKAFMEFEGRTLLSRALDLAHSITSNVSIVGSREKFSDYAPVVEDIFRDRGPLAGIHAALLTSQTDLNLMLGVDMPFVTQAFLRHLIAVARHAADDVAVVPSSAGRLQPLCAVYHREFARVAEKSLGSGRNKINPLFDIVPTRILEEAELEGAGFSTGIFRNLNTPEELESAGRECNDALVTRSPLPMNE